MRSQTVQVHFDDEEVEPCCCRYGFKVTPATGLWPFELTAFGRVEYEKTVVDEPTVGGTDVKILFDDMAT